jgi:hypothetical protein
MEILAERRNCQKVWTEDEKMWSQSLLFPLTSRYGTEPWVIATISSLESEHSIVFHMPIIIGALSFADFFFGINIYMFIKCFTKSLCKSGAKPMGPSLKGES